MTKPEGRVSVRHSGFGFHSDFGFRHSGLAYSTPPIDFLPASASLPSHGANSFVPGANCFFQGASSFLQGASSFLQGAHCFLQETNSSSPDRRAWSQVTMGRMSDKPTAKLTHLDEHGRATMVDVGQKPVTAREAVAEGLIELQPATLDAIAAGNVPKGDVFAAARIAGIMA